MENHSKQSSNNISDQAAGTIELNICFLRNEVERYYNNLRNLYSKIDPNSEKESAILTTIEKNRRELEKYHTQKLVKADNDGQKFMANWFLKIGTTHPNFDYFSTLLHEVCSVEHDKSVTLNSKKRSSDCDDDQSNKKKLKKENLKALLKKIKKEEKEPKKTRKEAYEEIMWKRKNKNKSNESNILLEQINTPEVVMEQYRELNGTELKLVIEKKLEKSDLNPQQDRLTIPEKQIRNEFLNDNEKNELLGEIKENEKGVPYIQVKVIEPCLMRFDVCLRIYVLKVSSSYILNRKWNQIAHRKANGFKEHDKVQVWSFRVDDQLWFQIVKV